MMTPKSLAMIIILCVLVGCAASIPHQAFEFAPSSQPSAPQAAQQSAGVAAISSQYQSELPWKAVLLLVSYVGLEAIKQSWIVYLSHKREIVRLNQRR
jgi:hypothetical protein